MTLSDKDAEPIVAKAKAERRRFRRVRLDLPGRLYTPADGTEARCSVINLSSGGASVECEMNPPYGTQVVLYVDNFGRFEGTVTRRNGEGFGVAFTCTPSKRERIAEQLTLFLNKAMDEASLLRRHERTHEKGFAKFTRADGQIVHCAVMDIFVGGVTLKTDVHPPVGEFVLIQGVAGKVARHHEQGISIEFVGQEKPANDQPAHKLNLVRGSKT